MECKRKYIFDNLNDCEIENCILTLWVEDDAPVPDKERVDSAFERMSGYTKSQCKRNLKRKIDRGDWIAFIYRNGWVKIISCEGGAVGVLIEEKEYA
jgi:hypothetical protein